VIDLIIKKDPKTGKWAAYQKGKEEKAVTSISITGGRFGFGISNPQYNSGNLALQTLQTINQSVPGACQGVGICLSYYKDGSVIYTKAYKQAEDFQKEPMFAIPLTGPAAKTAQ
jgi:hypothetical protein